MKLKVNKKKTAIILFLILIVFICGNAFAALVGAPNIFFAIKDLVSTEEKSGAEEILSDRDITISYSPIKIKDGLELQVNRILIEEEKSTLFITLENKNKDKDKETIGINVYDMLENNNTNDVLSEDKFLVSAESKENFEIELNKKVSEDEKLKLEIIVNEKAIARNIILDLASKEIVVEGKEETKKISEKELKEYLGCFALLSREDNINGDDLVYIAKILNDNVLKNEITDSGRELTNAIISSFYSDSLITENEDDSNYTSIAEISKITTYGLCLAINDILYNNGVYTIQYIYCLPTENDNIEKLQQYQATIKLEYNENSEYSKYKVISLTEGVKLDKSEEISVDNKKEENNVMDTSKTIEGAFEYLGEVHALTYVFEGNEVRFESLATEYGTYTIDDNVINIKFTRGEDPDGTEMTPTRKECKLIIKDENTLYDEKNNAEYKKIASNDKPESNVDGEKLIQFDNAFSNIEEVAKEYREYKNIKNYKDFEYDFDGDGKKDKVTIEHEKGTEEDRYAIKFNGETFITSVYYDKLYVVDLNENDKNIEVVIFTPGPSDDPTYMIYSQKGNKMELVSSINGLDLKTDKEGTILVKNAYNETTSPKVYFDYHFIKDSRVEEKNIDLSKVKDKELTLGVSGLCFSKDYDNLKRFYEEAELVVDKLEEYNIEKLAENTTFKILDVEKVTGAFDIEEYKIFVELSNGQKGYIFEVRLAG